MGPLNSIIFSEALLFQSLKYSDIQVHCWHGIKLTAQFFKPLQLSIQDILRLKKKLNQMERIDEITHEWLEKKTLKIYSNQMHDLNNPYHIIFCDTTNDVQKIKEQFLEKISLEALFA